MMLKSEWHISAYGSHYEYPCVSSPYLLLICGNINTVHYLTVALMKGSSRW